MGVTNQVVPVLFVKFSLMASTGGRLRVLFPNIFSWSIEKGRKSSESGRIDSTRRHAWRQVSVGYMTKNRVALLILIEQFCIKVSNPRLH